MMVRTQIQLTKQQMGALKRASAATGKSIAEVIRQSIDQYLSRQIEPGREERVKRAIQAAGMFRSGLTDVSTRHDDYLAEAYLE